MARRGRGRHDSDPEGRARPDVDCGPTRLIRYTPGVRYAIGKPDWQIHKPVLGARRNSVAGPQMKRLACPANLAIAGGLFALNIGLNIPLFESGEMPYRDSIEGGYASMARFFSAHPNPWGWNPMQYCGLPAQFT